MKRKILAGLVALLFSASVYPCVHSVEVTDTYVTACAAADACRTILYEDLSPGSIGKKEEEVRETFQAFLDTRLELVTFPAADPDKATDPNCENFYWGDIDGTPAGSLDATHLIARDCIIEDVTWNGGDFSFSVRRADRCN